MIVALITCVDCNNSISDEAPTCPKCGRPATKQPVRPASDVRRRESVRIPFRVAGIIAGTFIVLGVVAGLTKDARSPTPAAAAETAPPAAAAPSASEPTRHERAANWESLQIALAETTPFMDDTLNDHSEGTVLLTAWAIKRLKMTDILSLPETTRGRVMKDSFATRGSKLCVTGRVSQIQAERVGASTIYLGGIMRSYEVTRFVAVGDTGTIEEGSRARFCGIVTGRHSYSNTGGGTTIAPQLVGMFDLPTNL
jgi:hypothetical protein